MDSRCPNRRRPGVELSVSGRADRPACSPRWPKKEAAHPRSSARNERRPVRQHRPVKPLRVAVTGTLSARAAAPKRRAGRSRRRGPGVHRRAGMSSRPSHSGRTSATPGSDVHAQLHRRWCATGRFGRTTGGVPHGSSPPCGTFSSLRITPLLPDAGRPTVGTRVSPSAARHARGASPGPSECPPPATASASTPAVRTPGRSWCSRRPRPRAGARRRWSPGVG